MVDMLEGVEDICASLGLGHIPLLNEENRELNRKLQELQVRLNKITDTENRSKIVSQKYDLHKVTFTNCYRRVKFNK